MANANLVTQLSNFLLVWRGYTVCWFCDVFTSFEMDALTFCPLLNCLPVRDDFTLTFGFDGVFASIVSVADWFEGLLCLFWELPRSSLLSSFLFLEELGFEDG